MVLVLRGPFAVDRVRRRFAWLAVAASCLLSGSRSASLNTPTHVVTYHNDIARTGQNLTESFLTPTTVTSSTFGKIRFLTTDGKVDAQPLYLSGLLIPGVGVRDVVYVATEHDSVYAFDAGSGSTLWRVSLLGPGET